MASRKKIAAWLGDLREGTARKREAAAKRLARTDRDGARAVLLELVGPGAAGPALPLATRRVLRRCLRYVADLTVARMLVADGDVELDPTYLPSSVLAALCDDLRRALPGLAASEVERRITNLGVFECWPAMGENDDDAGWREERVLLLVAVLRDDRLDTSWPAAARAARWIDDNVQRRWESDPRPSQALVAAWDTGREVTVFDAVAAWTRLADAPPRPDLVRALTAGLASRLHESALEEIAQAHLDPFLAMTARRLTADEAMALLVLLSPGRAFPELTRATAERVVKKAPSAAALAELLDDARIAACHALAAAELVTRGPEGVHAVLERAARVPLSVLSSALAALPPDEAHAFLASHITAHTSTHHWYDALVGAPSVLRDPRCLELVAQIALPNRGRALLDAVARDLDSPARDAALPMISAARQSAAEAAEARLQKRHALHAIGQTRSPASTTLLIEALDDPDIGDIAPMVCTMLGEGADSRAIPALQERQHGRHAAFVAAAIEAVRERMAKERTAAFAAARDDDDPVIADLARSAADGDAEAAAVLEDALRERGRL